MFHHDHRVASVHQVIELAEQAVDIPWMQAGGGFVQHVQGRATGIALQLGGELDALRFAAGEFGRGLAKAQIAQADVA